MTPQPFPIRSARTPLLDVAYEEHGSQADHAVILLHGFPYDPRCYDAMIAPLLEVGCRVIVPYLRGFGPTRFLSDDTLRSGQQAALGQDLIDLMDALQIERASLVGYDWGGRAACIVAALWPQRVRCLVTGNGYNIQNIAASKQPQSPTAEYRLWYQYYFHTPRGEAGITADRAGLCRLLWKLWSPAWQFSDETFMATKPSFDNPDFVRVVIHSYRHRFGYVLGDPDFADLEKFLAASPAIRVPAISLCGADDGVGPPPGVDDDNKHFTAAYRRIVVPATGHNIPQEAPAETFAALIDLLGRT